MVEYRMRKEYPWSATPDGWNTLIFNPNRTVDDFNFDWYEYKINGKIYTESTPDLTKEFEDIWLWERLRR